MLSEIFLGVLPPLTDTLAGKRVPGPGLFDDPLVSANVDQLPLLGHAATVEDVEFRFSEWWGNLILHDLDLGAAADHFLFLLHGAGAADVQAHRGIEFERVATAGGLGVAENDADLHADLVDEDHQRARARDRARQLAQRLGHQPGLEAHLGLAHLAFDFGPRHQGGYGIDHDHVDRAAAHEGVSDLQGLLTVVRLRDEQVFGFDPKFARIAQVEGMLGINVGAYPAAFLRLGDN